MPQHRSAHAPAQDTPEEASGTGVDGDASFYDGYVVPRAAYGLAANPIDPSDDRPGSITPMLALLAQVPSSPDVQAVLGQVALPEVEQDPDEHSAEDSLFVSEVRDELFGAVKDALVDRLGFPAGIRSADALDWAGRDSFDPDNPSHPAILSGLDLDRDGALTAADVMLQAERNPEWREMLTGLAQAHRERMGARDRASTLTGLDSIVSAARGLQLSDAGQVLAAHEAFWPNNAEMLAVEFRSHARRDTDVYVARVFLEHAGELTATRGEARRADREAPSADALAALIRRDAASDLNLLRNPSDEATDELASSFGLRNITFRIGPDTTDPQLWDEPARRVLAEDPRAARIARPYQVGEIVLPVDQLSAAIRQASRFAYRVRVHLGRATPEEIDRADRIVQQLGQVVHAVQIRQVEVTPREFAILADQCRVGEQAGFARDRSGQTYDTQTPSGQRRRRTDVGNREGIDSANLQEDGSVLSSQLGERTSSELLEMREALRDPESEPEPGASSERIVSGHPSYDGLPLEIAAQIYFQEADALYQQVNHLLQEGGLHEAAAVQERASRALMFEVTADSFERGLGELDRIRAALRAEAGDHAPLLETVDTEKLFARVTAAHGALASHDKDERGLQDALFGLSEAELWHLERMYQDTYGADLRIHIITELDGPLQGGDRDEALAYLDGDFTLAHALRLEHSVSNVPVVGGAETDRIFSTLEALTPEQRQNLSTVSDTPDIKVPLDEVRAALDGNDAARFEQLLAGDHVWADAYALCSALGTNGNPIDPRNWGEDEDAVMAILSGKSKDHWAEVARAYEAITERALEDELMSLLDWDERVEAQAQMTGDAAGVGAMRLWRAAHGGGTDEDAIIDVFKGAGSAGARAAIATRYLDEFGESVYAMFEAEADSRIEFTKFDMYRRLGELEPGFALYVAMRGLGTSVDDLKATLAEIPPARIPEVARSFADWAFQFGELVWDDPMVELRKWLDADLSGRDRLEVEILLRGQPETPHERLRDAEDRYELETAHGIGGTLTAIGEIGSMDGLDRSETLERHMDELHALFQNGQLREGISEGEVQRLHQLVLADLGEFRSARSQVTTAILTGSKIAVALVATTFSGGAASPWLLAALEGATGVSANLALSGGLVGEQEIAGEVLTSAVSAGLGQVLDSKGALGTRIGQLVDWLGLDVTKKAAKRILTSMGQQGSAAMFDTLMADSTWRAGVDGGVAEQIVAALYQAMKTGGLAAAQAGAQGVMGEVLHPRRILGDAPADMVQGPGVTASAMHDAGRRAIYGSLAGSFSSALLNGTSGDLDELVYSALGGAVDSYLDAARGNAEGELTGESDHKRGALVDGILGQIRLGRDPRSIEVIRDEHIAGRLTDDQIEALRAYGRQYAGSRIQIVEDDDPDPTAERP